jgi:hypothetical protein
MLAYKIVETCNFGGDYPNESEVNLPSMSKQGADYIAEVINSKFCKSDNASRYWKVVKSDYVVVGGFEP